MRTILMGALLCTASFALPCAPAQQSEALRRQFLEYKAKGEQGDAKAQFNLGVCYENGNGVPQDYAEAVKWFRKAAEQSFLQAQRSLGICYYKGRGVEKNVVEAYAWYNLASRTDKLAAKSRDVVSLELTPNQVVQGIKRTKELRAAIETRRKSSGN